MIHEEIESPQDHKIVGLWNTTASTMKCCEMKWNLKQSKAI